MPVLIGATPANAGTQPTTNACFSNATTTYSDLVWTLAGEGAPDPITLGSGDITLGSSTLAVDIPATLLIAGYNLGLLTAGANNIPTTVYVARTATGVVGGPVTQVDNFTITATTNITDGDGIPGTGDEAATPLSVSEPLPNMVVTPSGGPVTFAQAAPGALGSVPLGTGGAPIAVAGSLFAQASVGGGLIKANFDCSPGTTIIDPPGGTSGTTFTPAAVVPFETVTVTAPPTAPVCTDETISVGANQTATVDLTNNCTDVNGNIDPSTYAVSALSPASPAGGTLTPTATPGVYSYDAPGTDPGPVTFTFTVDDLGGLTSNTATGTISVLANQCDATAGECSLTQIIVQPVVGTTMTFDKAPGEVFMTTVVLNGAPQVSTGAIQPVTVTNARGTAAAWNVTGYVTDIGIAGSTPTFSPLPGVTVPACSAAGSFGLVTTPDRNCIPGDNLGWDPTAQITHDRIAGDVAHVVAGPEHTASAADWLTQLITAGSGAPASATPPSTVPGPDGLGGLQEQNNLCGAPINQSGGTFQCDASLFLGVPASAGAGIYTGGLVLTLL
ncbi:MAG: Ig-like domain-containing protein [Acidimicrobiales bacterium]